MAKQSGNMFGSDVLRREAEQREIEAAVMGRPARPAAMAADGGPARKRGPGATTIVLTISREDKSKVKVWAAKHATTVSDLLHQWIGELPED